MKKIKTEFKLQRKFSTNLICCYRGIFLNFIEFNFVKIHSGPRKFSYRKEDKVMDGNLQSTFRKKEEKLDEAEEG